MSISVSDLEDLAKELFPIPRSVVGEGFDKSLEIVSRYLPFHITSVPSGSRVGDWTVPLAWNLNAGGGVFSREGVKVVDFDLSNIHVVSHSEPVDLELTGAELIQYIHTLPNNPNLIPYVTSYYKDTWGVCMKHEDLYKIAPNESYHVVIPASKVPGNLKLAEAVIPGELEEEILLSTYLCHPSMGNNELSGPLAMIKLWEVLSQRRNLYSYRFLISPETIGSISWLSSRYPQLQHKIREAIVLTCLGGPASALSMKLSNSFAINGQRSIMDRFLIQVEKEGLAHLREFTPLNGSDERQFSAPGARISTTQFARTVYGTYPEYHTSGDDLDYMDVSQVLNSAEIIATLLARYELVTRGVESKVVAGGEPHLSKHGLYPTLSTPDQHYGTSRDNLRYEGVALDEILHLMHLADGRTLLEISEKTGLPISRVEMVVEKLAEKGLISLC